MYLAYATEGLDSKKVFSDAGIPIAKDYENLELSLVGASPTQLDALVTQGKLEFYVENTSTNVEKRPRGRMYRAVESDGSNLPATRSIIPHLARQLEDLGVDGSNATVALIDTGINAEHHYFDDNKPRFFDGVNGRTAAYDDEGHGSWTAGIIDQLLPRAKLYALKGILDDGHNPLSHVLACFDETINAKPDLVSCSFGFTELKEIEGKHYLVAERVLAEALERTAKAGIVIVASSGNESELPADDRRPPTYLGKSRYVVSVGAIDADHEIARWGSSLGADVYALGSNIISAGPHGRHDFDAGSGTSGSAPIVAAVLAGILDYSRKHDLGLTVHDARDMVLDTADEQTSILLLPDGHLGRYRFKVLDIDEVHDKLERMTDKRR
jgi:subtilisin family serine protease